MGGYLTLFEGPIPAENVESQLSNPNKITWKHGDVPLVGLKEINDGWVNHLMVKVKTSPASELVKTEYRKAERLRSDGYQSLVRPIHVYGVLETGDNLLSTILAEDNAPYAPGGKPRSRIHMRDSGQRVSVESTINVVKAMYESFNDQLGVKKGEVTELELASVNDLNDLNASVAFVYLGKTELSSKDISKRMRMKKKMKGVELFPIEADPKKVGLYLDQRRELEQLPLREYQRLEARQLI